MSAPALVYDLPPPPDHGFKLRPGSGGYYAWFMAYGKVVARPTGERDHDRAHHVAMGIVARESYPANVIGPGVYAVRGGEMFKIGMARVSIYERIRNLQIASPVELRLVGVLSPDPKDEKRAHRLFSEFHVRGEWFRATADALARLRCYAAYGLPEETCQR